MNKLLYRSKQRGFLELDLLVGLWAESELPRMSVQGLHQFAQVLDEVSRVTVGPLMGIVSQGPRGFCRGCADGQFGHGRGRLS